MSFVKDDIYKDMVC